ncbi:MAG: hypothetical protein NC334_09280, partial [Bacteroides sp.]|nr:hypothetical protein [Bacteroides sp.]
MKHFKKRTIALVLASVITVAGSFAAGNYKNSLMSLNFETAENGAVNMSVETKSAYSGNVTPVRRDANTYILTLSEMNNMVNGEVNLQNVAGNIQSVEVKTLPYTNSQKGYTRVIIKTHNSVNIIGQNKIFIPSQNNTPAVLPASHPQPQSQQVVQPKVQEQPSVPVYNNAPEKVVTPEQAENIEPHVTQPQVEESTLSQPQPEQNIEAQPVSADGGAERDPAEGFLLVMGILLASFVIIYLAVRAKNKLQEITGEKMEIDVNDDEDVKPKKEKESKRKQIKNTIKKLDAAYSKSAVSASKIDYPQLQEPAKPATPVEELNVVDLDELFKEQQEKQESNIEDSENDALDDFLSGFSFDEVEYDIPEEEQSPGYDVEFYDKIINGSVTFNQNDVDCINQLLNNEIDDEAIDAIKDETPKVVQPSEQQVLENLVTTYAVSQNIMFSEEDIATLRKLISIEIDPDFITDLRTNPERTKEMQEEILADKPKKRKPSEILTLNVKDMLPDLSEALRKQGGRKIESEVKPITVYASEGWEVNTLSLDDVLPDLSVEINNEDAYVSKPSAEIQLVDTSYEVEKLNTSDMLPNLDEAMKNPEMYNKPEPEPVEVDEEALLKNISNVQFKPFYDGSETFEILNDFDTPSIDDIQNEFSQFENFETANIEEETYTPANDDYDDFQALYSNEYFDLDNMQNEPEKEIEKEPETEPELIVTESEVPSEPEVHNEPPKVEKTEEEFIPKNLERKRDENNFVSKRERTKLSEEILKKIEATKAERIKRRDKVLQKKQQPTAAKQNIEQQTPEIKCILDGVTYTVVSTIEFSNNKGCHLTKTEKGYAVLGFINNKFIKLKEFESLKSERMAFRLSEKVSDDISRYIIRIGLEKFILSVTSDNIEYLMAL